MPDAWAKRERERSAGFSHIDGVGWGERIALGIRMPMRLRRRRGTPMWCSAVAVGLAALAGGLVIAAPARAAPGTWDRAWGKDVDVAVARGSRSARWRQAAKRALMGARRRAQPPPRRRRRPG